MATDSPHSCWLCINEQCEVTIFGLQTFGLTLPKCPRCTGMALHSSLPLWQVSMIAGWWLKTPGVEYPKA